MVDYSFPGGLPTRLAENHFQVSGYILGARSAGSEGGSYQRRAGGETRESSKERTIFSHLPSLTALRAA
jgi:hypothetical protein